MVAIRSSERASLGTEERALQLCLSSGGSSAAAGLRLQFDSCVSGCFNR